MGEPPPSAHEMQLGGEALCGMVYELRQKEGIPDPQTASKIEIYRTSAPCIGNPAVDDPFPSEHAEQVGIRAIDMANTIQERADACIKTMEGGGGNADAVRRRFA